MATSLALERLSKLLDPIRVVISELGGQRIKKVSRIVKEQGEILKALGTEKMPKILPQPADI